MPTSEVFQQDHLFDEVPESPETSYKLMLFYVSLNEGSPGFALKRTPSIESKWDDLVSNSSNKFFPTSNLLPQVVQPPCLSKLLPYQDPVVYIKCVSKEDFQAYIKANDALLERELEVTKDTMHPLITDAPKTSTSWLSVVHMISDLEPVNAPLGKFQFPADFCGPSIYDARHEFPNSQEEFLKKTSFSALIGCIRRLLQSYDGQPNNDVIDMLVRYSQEFLVYHMLLSVIHFITKINRLYWSPTLNLFEGSDFLLFEDQRNEPPEVETLKDLPPHFRICILKGNGQVALSYLQKILKNEGKRQL
ncbi:hypothetical protein Tco_1218003 [Tanacetum coccineum]